MFRSKDYIIEFNKLRNGHNELVFKIDNEFFKELSGGAIQYPSEVQVNVQLNKTATLFDLSFRYTGHIVLTCDRCLDELNWPVDAEAHLIIKLSEFERYDDDEIIYISPQAISFNMAQPLYDNLMVTLPGRHTCEMAAKACSMPPEKLNSLTLDKDESEDPRWEKLKTLTDKKSKTNTKTDK